MENNIESGDRLVCTRAEWRNGNGIARDYRVPKEGQMVTVRETHNEKGVLLVSLMGFDPCIFFPAKHFDVQMRVMFGSVNTNVNGHV